MSRTIVVISELIDATIREGQPDTTFIIKHSMAELAEHIETTPIRADYLYFTQDVIPHTNTSLNFLTQMLENPFLKVDNYFVVSIGRITLPDTKPQVVSVGVFGHVFTLNKQKVYESLTGE